jgi:TetR/AcrR family transcriptional regulator
VDPYHLIFAIWAVTQHYADFSVQVDAVLGRQADAKSAQNAVIQILLRGLKPA